MTQTRTPRCCRRRVAGIETASHRPRDFFARLASCVAFVGAGLPANAAEPATTPVATGDLPITVRSCTVGEQSVLENPKIGLRMSHVSGVTIVYTNERGVAATEVRFRIRYGGQTFVVVDRGAFAAGQTIKREFTSFDAIFNGANAECTPTAAGFADGSRWAAPATPQAPAGRH